MFRERVHSNLTASINSRTSLFLLQRCDNGHILNKGTWRYRDFTVYQLSYSVFDWLSQPRMKDSTSQKL